MKALRRHYLYAEQENETSVGDADTKTNVLKLWLSRRQQLITSDSQIPRYLVLFWDLAKGKHATSLGKREYVAFFQCVTKALVQSVNNDYAPAVAARDWQYDCAGGSLADDETTRLSLPQFKEALFQVAELILPVESDASMFASFFLELRDAITDAAYATDSNDPGTATYTLCALKGVVKIRGAFLQKLPPNADHLAQIRGLASPETETMSLKQLLLSYNPRKFSLSRKFSSLFGQAATTPESVDAVAVDTATATVVAALESSRLSTTPAQPSALSSREAEDRYDFEEAVVDSISTFPALRIAVVGPPGVGKSRVARALAKRLDLKYVSVALAIEDAIAAKRVRDEQRREHLRIAEEAREIALAAVAASEASAEGEESSAAVTVTAVDVSEGETKSVDPEDLLFGDGHLATLMRGEALSSEAALPILVAFVRKILLSGIGVVVDAVFPSSVASEIAMDYVVSLEMSREDAENHSAGLMLAPVSRMVYSARERAMLTECDTVLREKGFGDEAIFEATLDPMTGRMDTEEQQSRRARIAGAMAAAAMALLPPTPKLEDGDENAGEEDVAPVENGESAEDESDGTHVSVVAPPTAAERNDVPPLDEPTVPLRSLLKETYSDRYKAYLQQSATLATMDPAVRVVAVLAAQALHDIVSQCVLAITNSVSEQCRSAKSRAVLPITLPEEVMSTGNAAEQTRWLLYRDWTEYLAEAPPTAFATGPVDPSQPRRLSRWRLCCPVSSISGTTSVIVRGDPQFAGFYNGFIYVFASASARETFAAAPQQYIRREPPVLPATRKLWVLSNGSLEPSTASAIAVVVQGSWVSAVSVISESQSLQQTMALVEGKVMPASSGAEIVAAALTGSNAWVLTDLPVTKETIDVLREHDVVPDAVVILSPSEADHGHFYPSPLDKKRLELWTAQCGAAEDSPLSTVIAEAQLPTPFRCPLYRDVSETQAALRRLLLPSTPRVDSTDDGTMRSQAEVEEEFTTVFTSAADQQEEPTEDAESSSDNVDDGTGYDAKQKQWLARRSRMGETAQYCPVSWASKASLVPGLPQFVASYQQKLYAFAGAQQLEAFTRNPTAYLPSQASVTGTAVPVIFLLGVRGIDVGKYATSLTCRGICAIDEAAVVARIERRLRVQLLLPVDTQKPMLEIYVEELKAEWEAMVASKRWQAVVVANPSLASVRIPPQLTEGNDGSSEEQQPASPLPATELLDAFYREGLYPTLVIALETSEERAVRSQLMRWKAAQPPAWKREKHPSGEEAEAEEEGEKPDPVGLETAETTRLQEQYQADVEALTAAVESMRSRGVSIASAVNVDATPRAVLKLLGDSVTQYVQSKHSLFEYCERVSDAGAVKLLQSGQVLVGKHGAVCPITGREPADTVPRLLYRGRLYFPATDRALAECEASPAAMLSQRTSQPPLTRVCCAVVGAPGSGKSRLAHEIAKRLGLVHISPQTAIEWVLQCLGQQTTLWSKLKHIRASERSLLDPHVVHEAITLRLTSAACQRLGWVLDEYLGNSEQLALSLGNSESRLVHPGVLFVLESSRNYQQSTEQPASRHAQFVAWQKHRLDLQHTWISSFGGFHYQQIDVDATSAWQAAALATHTLDHHVSASRTYYQATTMQRPADLYGVLRTQPALEASVHSVLQSFCPVELGAGRYHTTEPHTRELCVEYAMPKQTPSFFWFANRQNLEAFAASPRMYLSDEALETAKTMITKAPVDASLLSLLAVADCEFPEMKGYCPVTFQQGTGDKDWLAIVKGSIFYRVSYDGKVFFCLTEAKRRAFIRQPSLYASLVLPIKLPPQLAMPLSMKSCPGRIEQELSGVLNETLLLLGGARPKFVGVGVRASACFYLALQLKARATKAQPGHIRAKYAQRLRAFDRDCRLGEVLKLGTTSTSCGPGVKGARAVRELSAVSDAATSEMPAAGRSDAPGENESIEALIQRFDLLIQSSSRSKNVNHQPATPRVISEPFLEYATPFITPHY